MSILVIRKHQRFAVVRRARLQSEHAAIQDGLLIEVSLQGCRIGNVDDRAFSMGQPVRVGIEGYGEMEGEVRWIGDARIGLHLAQPFHSHELDRLLSVCRGEVCSLGRLRA